MLRVGAVRRCGSGDSNEHNSCYHPHFDSYRCVAAGGVTAPTGATARPVAWGLCLLFLSFLSSWAKSKGTTDGGSLSRGAQLRKAVTHGTAGHFLHCDYRGDVCRTRFSASRGFGKFHCPYLQAGGSISFTALHSSLAVSNTSGHHFGRGRPVCWLHAQLAGFCLD